MRMVSVFVGDLNASVALPGWQLPRVDRSPRMSKHRSVSVDPIFSTAGEKVNLPPIVARTPDPLVSTSAQNALCVVSMCSHASRPNRTAVTRASS